MRYRSIKSWQRSFWCYPFINAPTTPKSLTTSDLFSVSIILPFWECYNKWNHTVWELLRLAFFIQNNTLEIHPKCCVYQKSPSSHCWVVFHGVDIPQFLNHSPIEGYYSCFEFAIITNKSSINNTYRVAFCRCALIYLGYIPRMIIAALYELYV